MDELLYNVHPYEASTLLIQHYVKGNPLKSITGAKGRTMSKATVYPAGFCRSGGAAERIRQSVRRCSGSGQRPAEESHPDAAGDTEKRGRGNLFDRCASWRDQPGRSGTERQGGHCRQFEDLSAVPSLLAGSGKGLHPACAGREQEAGVFRITQLIAIVCLSSLAD